MGFFGFVLKKCLLFILLFFSFFFFIELCCSDGWRIWREVWRRTDGCDARTNGEQVMMSPVTAAAAMSWFFFYFTLIYQMEETCERIGSRARHKIQTCSEIFFTPRIAASSVNSKEMHWGEKTQQPIRRGLKWLRPGEKHTDEWFHHLYVTCVSQLFT